MTDLYLVRHGETEWSRNGRHTSTTDLDLTEAGQVQAAGLRDRLNPADFGLVLCSPRLRARHTAELAGFDSPEIEPDLAEWDYGDFEGLTGVEIRTRVPSWRIWNSHVPGGEQAADIVARLNRVANRVRFSGVERAICFGHGHALRVLAMVWVGLDLAHGAALPLATGSLSVLGYEKESSAILHWNF